MKLAILAQSYLFDEFTSINGTLVQLHNLAQGFSKSEIDVHYICSTKDKTKPAYEFKDGIHFYWLQHKNGLLGWKQLMPLYKEKLNTVKPDAVYVRGRNTMQYVAGAYANKANIPYVWGTNGDDSAEQWKNLKRLKYSKLGIIKTLVLLPLKAYEDMYINKGMKLPTSIVNQSIQQKNAVKKLLNKEGIVLPSYFLPVVHQSEKKDMILWLATLSKQKQPDKFIDIINRSKLNQWYAVLGGGTNNQSYNNNIDNKLKGTKIKRLGIIEFKDSFKYYQEAKIYINTSLPDADGLPNAYLQSWLSGTIVLSLHHDPNKWMKKHNIGFCSYGDEEKLVSKLQELIASPETITQMSNNAKKFAEAEFSNDKIIQTYKKLFKGNA
ncbi:glycosyltransferase family 4 protein [Winogradskyella echinorum]|uniref:Glycosyltransferase family 4 protein n=1 Tax=Winogradskyella echinorum TaxID=538189 RepID=A0ABR6XXC4_9FLAO|nr:glycosyltransferase family 4 protein [Winogradskyella echinorum]MBC3845169.1 glycosyltransferase family 4 protein [Winogradskyella echinorum]MBC5749517.1 glycosyltransferase family 4 protein [Winogradskyella echinorum]